MSNIFRKGLAVVFLLATAVGGEEFFRHMVYEDNIQQEVRASQPYSVERDGLIHQREAERGMALAGLGGALSCLALAGVAVPGKAQPKASPG